MRRLFVVGCVVLSAFTVACGEIPPSPTAPETPVVVPNTPVTAPQVTRLSMVPFLGHLYQPDGGFAELNLFAGDSQRGVAQVTIALSATAGTLSATEIATDDRGYATVRWSGTKDATVRASVGDLVQTVTIVAPIPTPPPPAPRPRPTPTPTPDPTPAPPALPAFVAVLTAQNPSVAVNAVQTYTVAVSDLQLNESVVSYSWQFEEGLAAAATTVVPTRAFTYTTHGTKRPQVTVATSLGRTLTASTSVVVTSLLR